MAGVDENGRLKRGAPKGSTADKRNIVEKQGRKRLFDLGEAIALYEKLGSIKAVSVKLDVSHAAVSMAFKRNNILAKDGVVIILPVAAE